MKTVVTLSPFTASLQTFTASLESLKRGALTFQSVSLVKVNLKEKIGKPTSRLFASRASPPSRKP